MNIVEENLEESHIALQNKKQQFKDAQTVRSRILLIDTFKIIFRKNTGCQAK